MNERGKRDYKTAKRLLDKIKTLGITVEKYATDWWSSFIKTFKDEHHAVWKEFTQDIEGNNCRIRHQLRRAFRKSIKAKVQAKKHYTKLRSI
ncbi:IS1 family transposase [Breznakiellaceae bacterium SP9]